MLPAPLAAQSPRGPVLVLGVDSEGEAFVVLDDGNFEFISISSLKAEWRYDWRKNRWMDVQGFGDSGQDEEEADDGSEEVSGRISDTDGADGGDTGEGEYGASRDVDPSEAPALDRG
jgi:hypothetical protein